MTHPELKSAQTYLHWLFGPRPTDIDAGNRWAVDRGIAAHVMQAVLTDRAELVFRDAHPPTR